MAIAIIGVLFIVVGLTIFMVFPLIRMELDHRERLRILDEIIKSWAMPDAAGDCGEEE